MMQTHLIRTTDVRSAHSFTAQSVHNSAILDSTAAMRTMPAHTLASHILMPTQTARSYTCPPFLNTAAATHSASMALYITSDAVTSLPMQYIGTASSQPSRSDYLPITSYLSAVQPQSVLTNVHFGSLPTTSLATTSLYRLSSTSMRSATSANFIETHGTESRPTSRPSMTSVQDQLAAASNTFGNSVNPRKLLDLPEFSGLPEDWPIFFTSFVQSTAAYNYSNL